MKLLIIIHLNPFYISSASANRWRTLIEGLANIGVRVELLITGGFMSHQEWLQSKTNNRPPGIKFHYLSFLFHHNIWLRRFNRYLLEAIVRPLIEYKVMRVVKRNPRAIIWTSGDMISLTLATKIKRKHPEIFIFHELNEFLDIHKINRGNSLQRLKSDTVQTFFEQKAYFAFDGLALMTKTLLNHFKAFPQGPELLHLPMTVDLARFNNNIPSLDGFEKPYIAFVGAMSDAKDGVNVLIEAFYCIHNHFPEYKLYLIGGWNYDTPAHLKKIKRYNLENKVTWKGEFTRDQIPAIIQNASLLVLPRPDSKQAQGGFPTKLGEYLATGNPVCATRVGEIPDYLTDGVSVYFAEPGSIESFSEVIKRALSNPEDAKRIGMNGRKVAEKHFNKDIQAKNLYNFFKEHFLR